MHIRPRLQGSGTALAGSTSLAHRHVRIIAEAIALIGRTVDPRGNDLPMQFEDAVYHRHSVPPGQSQYVGGSERQPEMIGVIEGSVGNVISLRVANSTCGSGDRICQRRDAHSGGK
jgi:hypothetical protein